MAFYAICSNGCDFAGYTAPTIEGAIFQHVPDGGYPEPSTDPATDTFGFWDTGMIEVYHIRNPDLQRILEEERITDLRCEGEGDFTSGIDYEAVGRYRWSHTE